MGRLTAQEVSDRRQRQISWAHSVFNDPGAGVMQRKRAAAVLRKLDPEALQGPNDCTTRLEYENHDHQ